MKSSLAVLLAVLLATASAQVDCPDPVSECEVDPCAEQECPRFYSAECRPNLCFGGLCTANFFWRGRNVTERCDVETCDERVCPPSRQCMEQVRPPQCPDEGTPCRQYLATSCDLRPPPNRTMSCTEVSCEEGQACRMRDRGPDFPPVVRCVPASNVRECVPGTCNEGFTCVDNGPSVSCMLPPTSAPPMSCDVGFTLFCARQNNTCQLEDGIPRCVPAASCMELICPLGFECRESQDGVGCIEAIPTGNCTDLICNALGLVCTEFFGVSICLPASNCEELDTICRANTPSTVCEQLGEELAICVPPESCDLVDCGSEFLRCVDGGNFSVCISTTLVLLATSCSDLSCTLEQQFCLITSIPSEDLNLAQCASEEDLANLPQLTQTCESAGPTACNTDAGEECFNNDQNGMTVSFFCNFLNCFETLDGMCPFDLVCQNITHSLVRSACISLEIPSSFEVPCSESEVTCDPGLVCTEGTISTDGGGRALLGSFCSPEMPIVRESCDSLSCDTEEGEVCGTIAITPPLATNSFVASCLDQESADSIRGLVSLLMGNTLE